MSSKYKTPVMTFGKTLVGATLFISLLSPSSFAGTSGSVSCEQIFSETNTLAALETKTPAIKSVTPKTIDQDAVRALEDNYRANNEKLANRYPNLRFVFKDPEAYVTEMRARFEKQKDITPEDPRLFDYPEAKPTIDFIKNDLIQFRQELIAELQIAKKSLVNKALLMGLKKQSSKVKDLNKALRYVNRLDSEISDMLNSNRYPYINTVYMTYFYSRVRGYFQFKDLTSYYQVTKWIDMFMHGYRKKDMDTELSLFKNLDSPIVQVRSSRIASEFRIAEVPFKKAFDNKDELEFIVIPSVYALGSSAFMHILPHSIHIIGATNSPIQADGFNRPGGLFWMHDVRHEADRFMKITGYSKTQSLNEKQHDLLKLYMHKWHNEVIALKNSFSDPNIKNAINHYHFYTHHDVGVPMIPSMFLNHHENGLSVYYAFLFHKKNADQGPDFQHWVKSTQEAQRVLTKFWSDRLQIEKDILGKEPLKIESWEELFKEAL